MTRPAVRRPAVRHRPFDTAPGGADTELWHLDSGTGVQAEILTHGAVLHRLTVPDTRGETASVVRSLPSIEAYARGPYVGAVVGRYANRIAHGRFTLDDAGHRIPANDRGHALHGGPDGFDGKIWRATGLVTEHTAAVSLALHSPHGDMGFPGALDVTVTYTLDAAGTLAVDFTATTDRPTVQNLTNHAYFTLAPGAGIAGHTLKVMAGHYLPVDPDGIPYGPRAEVAGTPFDLTAPVPLYERLAPETVAADEQLRQAGGFDHCWVLTGSGPTAAPRPAARLTAPDERRVMEVWTTEPGIQVYTANQLDGTLTDTEGHPLAPHTAICLETQHLPDSPNRPEYPTTVLRPGTTARSRTEYRFPHLDVTTDGGSEGERVS